MADRAPEAEGARTVTVWDYFDKNPGSAAAFAVLLLIAILAFAAALEGRRR